MIPRRDVGGIVWKTRQLVRQLKNFLAVIDELLWTVRIVKRNQVRERPQVRLTQRLQVIGDLRPEFESSAVNSSPV